MLHDPNQNTLFPKLPDEALAQMQQFGTEIKLNPGETLFSEGDKNYHFHVVIDGEIEVTKIVGQETRILARHRRGGFMGELSMLTSASSIATARAIAPSSILKIDINTFRHILSECSPLADVILSAMAARTQDVEAQLRQQEKLAALGKMSAGLAHELNNPAAASIRAAGQLRIQFQGLQTLALHLNSLTTGQLEYLINLLSQSIEYTTKAPRLNPLAQSDKEDEIADWLEDNNIDNAWKLSPTLVSAGFDIEKLDKLAENIPADILTKAITWLEASLNANGLINDIENSTVRISDLVKAIKGYSYMDSAPLQEIDIHDGIENTLLILNHRIKKGVIVKKECDRTLPKINAYASELNQVWTNLIDNAIDAMDGKGDLTIRTYRDNDCIIVEIGDTGIGIPAPIQSRIFEPFFTTKAVGKGTGLGLEISYRIIIKRHQGNIYFDSKPGDTRFRVHLPIQPGVNSCDGR